MGDVGDQVVGRFKAAAQTHHIGADAARLELGIVHLAMRGIRGVQAARARIGYMRGNLRELQALHELLGCRASAGEAEAHHAAGAIRHVFFRQVVVLVAFEARVTYESNLRVALQEFRHGQAVLAMLRHAHMQAFQRAVQEERRLRVLHGAQVAHQLSGGFRDECALEAEFFRIRYAVIAFVGRGEAGEFIGMRHPVEFAGVDNRAAKIGCVAIHILSGGVRHDVGAPFDGAAIHGRGEGVVDHERHAMRMRGIRESLDVEHGERGVGDRFAEHELGVGLEGRLEFLVGAVGGNERAAQAHAAHGVGEQVVRAAVNGRACHHMVAHAGDIEDGQEVCRHARACEHGCRATFHFGDFCGNEVACGVLQAAVEIARLFQVEELAHMLRGVIFPGG